MLSTLLSKVFLVSLSFWRASSAYFRSASKCSIRCITSLRTPSTFFCSGDLWQLSVGLKTERLPQILISETTHINSALTSCCRLKGCQIADKAQTMCLKSWVNMPQLVTREIVFPAKKKKKQCECSYKFLFCRKLLKVETSRKCLITKLLRWD